MLAIPNAVTMRPRPWGRFMFNLISMQVYVSHYCKDYVPRQIRTTHHINREGIDHSLNDRYASLMMVVIKSFRPERDADRDWLHSRLCQVTYQTSGPARDAILYSHNTQ